MNLHVINTGFFKLDGGAMFGVVPKSLWQRHQPADENNLCTWAMRCLLLEDGDRLVLIDNGIGDKQDARFFKHYYLHGEDSLKGSLQKAGFGLNEVTDMFLTHLHFDHCGGGVEYRDSSRTNVQMVFPNAKYWTHEAHWNWALKPNPREKASFLKENLLPMQESGHLHFVRTGTKTNFSPFDVITVDGHTEKQMLPKIQYKGRTIVFAADLLPSTAHIGLPWVMAYDVRPLVTMEEKAALLEEVVTNDYVLFFEHDPVHECATLKQTDKGIRIDQTFSLSEL